MSILRGDASEIYALASDLSQITGKTVPALRGVMADAGEALADEWRDNAREHFHPDGHAGRYPDSIDSELVFQLGSVSVDVGPNFDKATGGRSQAFLGPILEFGGERSPAYLDGLHALDGFQQRAERMIDSTMGYLFG